LFFLVSVLIIGTYYAVSILYYRIVINVSNIIVGVKNHTNFAASLVRYRLVSQIGGGISGSFYRRKSVSCHVGMYVKQHT
jgi:hypothetical protein